MAVQYYEKNVFGGATFADIKKRRDAPLVLINASDLGYGVRFSFVQEYFNLLCSDISNFPVSRAVTASSAVPVLFNPVVVQNYPDCKDGARPDWLIAAEERALNNADLLEVVSGLGSYFDYDRRKYAHFVDGGITDNLGLRAIYEVIEVAGGIKAFQGKYNRRAPTHAVLISVNASTDPEPEMDLSRKQPSLMETVNAMSDVQLHRYNAATLELMHASLQRWAEELSTPSRKVAAHFVQVDFRAIDDPQTRLFFNGIPTSFDLTDQEVDRLILAGRELLRSNPEFQRFLSDLKAFR
jgi:NTE family protein